MIFALAGWFNPTGFSVLSQKTWSFDADWRLRFWIKIVHGFVSQREEDFCRSKKHHIFCSFLWFYQRALTRQDIFFCFLLLSRLKSPLSAILDCQSCRPQARGLVFASVVSGWCDWKPENSKFSWLRHADWWSWAACNCFVAVGTPRSIFRSVERWPLNAPRSSKSLPVFIDFYPKKFGAEKLLPEG